MVCLSILPPSFCEYLRDYSHIDTYCKIHRKQSQQASFMHGPIGTWKFLEWAGKELPSPDAYLSPQRRLLISLQASGSVLSSAVPSVSAEAFQDVINK